MSLGRGSYSYEIAEGWAKLPADVALGFTHGVVTDRDDNVYVFNQSRHAVVKLDRDGNYRDSWGEEFAAGAHGLFLAQEPDGSESLLLCDYKLHQVVKTTLDGRELLRLGVPELADVYPEPGSYLPTDAAVAANGDLYVCDGYGQGWIHQYSPQGERIRSWGGKGSEPGKMDCPHGIWIDSRGPEPLVYVADRGNVRIQLFTLDGEHVRFVEGDLRYPCCFYEFEGDLYIPDLHSRLTILDERDRLIAHLGDGDHYTREGWPNRDPSERRPDEFVSPHAACVDSRGDVYVVEWVPDGRLTKLVRQ